MQKNWLVGIAQVVRTMENKEAKDYIVSRWERIKEISRQLEQVDELIKAICSENLEALKKII